MPAYGLVLAYLESYGLDSLAIFDSCSVWNDGNDWDDYDFRDLPYELPKRAAKHVVCEDEKYG